MKIQITMKDPDGVYDAIMEASCRGLEDFDEDQKDRVVELRQEKIGEQLKNWIRFGELVTIEFDLDAGTARVAEATT